MLPPAIGPYRVLERLGAGGMGEVFLAEDPRLRRRVAIKRLNSEHLSSAETRSRILREARAAARLHHPGIASIFDIVDDGEHVCIVMEYVDGETLAARLARGPLPIDDALRLAAAIADALDDAHAHGVLHCDLKPANIHLTRAGQPKVLDFGVAQMSSAAAAGDQTRLVTSTVDLSPAGLSGSPGYLAPERLSGAAPDERGDVYAMGVMLFEMLTGRRPFVGPSLVAAAAAALASPPPSPSSVNGAIPADVSDVVLRALSREPAARFPTARAFADALRALRTAPALSAPPRAERVPRAGRRAIVAIAVVIVLAGVAAVATVWRPWRSEAAVAGAAPTVAVKPLVNLGRDAANDALGVGITDDLTSKLAALPHVAVVPRDTTAAYVVANAGSTALARDLGASFVVDGGFEQSGELLRVTLNLTGADGAVLWTRRFARPLQDLSRLQREMAEGLADGLRLTLTDRERGLLAAESTRNVNALADYSQGRLFLDRRDVKDNIDHAIEAFERAVAADAGFALAHAGLGAAYWEKYLSTKDAAWTARAISASLEALRLNANLAEVHVALGTIYAGLGQTSTAVTELTQALAIQPNSDNAHRGLGDIFAKDGRIADAVNEYQQAIAIRPNYWQNYNRLAATFMKVGRYADAESAYERITQLQPDSSVGFNNLGVVKMMQDDLAAGLTSLQRAASITPKPGTFSNIGTIEYWNGRFGEARAAYAKAVALSPNDPTLYRNLGDANAGLNDAAGARTAYLKALDLAQEQARVNPKDATTLSLIAVLDAKLKRQADARAQADRANALAPNDSEVLYRSAIVSALAGERDAALADLKAAIAAGYSLRLIRRDLDLRILRELPGFTALMDAKQP